jgi:hypothetical protein
MDERNRREITKINSHIYSKVILYRSTKTPIGKRTAS